MENNAITIPQGSMTPEEIAVILTRLEERIVRIERLLQEIAQGMGIET
jgi:hypothetical protein